MAPTSAKKIAFILEPLDTASHKVLKEVAEVRLGHKNTKYTENELSQCEELNEKTVGIVGLGQSGSELAKRLSCFNVKTVSYDPYVTQAQAKQLKVKMVGLEELLCISDIITLHCELNKNTEIMISGPQLKQMKRNAYLVNTARGGLIDTQALYNALKEELIAGAALDVFEEEPTKTDNPLFSLENIIHTPHMAGVTFEVMKRDPIRAAEETVRILKGEPGKNVLNPEYNKNIRTEID